MGEALVVNGATVKCDKSDSGASMTFTVLPTNMTKGDDKDAGTEDDYIPMVNIPSFIMCSKNNTANPMVVSMTAAAQGTPTPAPCIPIVTAKWDKCSSVVKIHDKKALIKTSECKCQWNGKITIDDPGTTTIKVDP
jgi:hypothetical protein